MITVCLVITNYDINGQNNENVEKRVVRLSFLMKGTVIMNLVIAEKPSVAQSIAKVIGATTKQDGYLEGLAGPGNLRLGPTGAETRISGQLVRWSSGGTGGAGEI